MLWWLEKVVEVNPSPMVGQQRLCDIAIKIGNDEKKWKWEQIDGGRWMSQKTKCGIDLFIDCP